MRRFPLHRDDIAERFGKSKQVPQPSPGHDVIPVENREGSDTRSGQNARLSWGARTDIGLIRSHNEDSFLIQPPLFAVSDGMGGHAAGEVASSIAVATIAERAPLHADDLLLGAAIEAANIEVIDGAANGKGKVGMGCTASCVLIENSRMAIGHVGDSRIYLLHRGTLVRLTHDHSYVEELVDAGEITADEARVHPSRSVVTRALGSDPDMYADHFTLDVTTGDRIIICSDGLSSMVEDSSIEATAVSSATAQQAADNLVSAALAGGGHDNVTVVVVDVEDDGVADEHMQGRRRWFVASGMIALVLVVCLCGFFWAVLANSWYVGNNNGTVGIYHGLPGDIVGLPLGQLVETTSIETKDLPTTVQNALNEGMPVASEDVARQVIDSYRDQIDADKTTAAVTADRSTAGTNTSKDNPATPVEQTNSNTSQGGE